jgi:hypothetical protein
VFEGEASISGNFALLDSDIVPVVVEIGVLIAPAWPMDAGACDALDPCFEKSVILVLSGTEGACKGVGTNAASTRRGLPHAVQN